MWFPLQHAGTGYWLTKDCTCSFRSYLPVLSSSPYRSRHFSFQTPLSVSILLSFRFIWQTQHCSSLCQQFLALHSAGSYTTPAHHISLSARGSPSQRSTIDTKGLWALRYITSTHYYNSPQSHLAADMGDNVSISSWTMPEPDKHNSMSATSSSSNDGHLAWADGPFALLQTPVTRLQGNVSRCLGMQSLGGQPRDPA